MPSSLKRREFLGSVALGATAMALPGCTITSTRPGEAARRPVLMKPGHQHDHSTSTLRALAAFGVKNICSGRLGPDLDDWSVENLSALRRQIESFGIALDCLPLPMSPREVSRAEMPAILLTNDPEARDRAIAAICQMIRNAGAVGVPMVKYNLSLIGMVRTGRVISRGGASSSAFDYSQLPSDASPTIAGRISEEEYWSRITYFLERVVPVAESAKVKIALHPQDPGMPKGKGYREVETVLGSVDGLKRFVETVPSPYHGLNFCQGTVAEMLEKPGEEIYDVIRWFGSRQKIFIVHFRNISGGFGRFHETFPDDGDVDMPRALRVYRECGYDGMIMPDHVPQIEGDERGQKAFAYCFGYIQALLQGLRET